MLDQETYPDASVVKFLGRVVPVRINVDKQPEIARMYRATTLPTLLFLHSDGRPYAGFIGFRPPKEFVQTGKEILALEKKKK